MNEENLQSNINDQEETYRLTPLGVLVSKYGADAKGIIDTLTSHCKMIENNAILFNEFPGQFINVEFYKEWDEEGNE